MSDEDLHDDEIISVRLPRHKYDRLRKMIERDEAYGYWEGKLKNGWIWLIGGGLLTLFLTWEKIHSFIAVKV